jgi:hypothetical protein
VSADGDTFPSRARCGFRAPSGNRPEAHESAGPAQAWRQAEAAAPPRFHGFLAAGVRVGAAALGEALAETRAAGWAADGRRFRRPARRDGLWAR